MSYNLPRDATESSRLNRQHEVYLKNAGYRLHPTIAASLPPDPHIGEVGTGTSIWLRELAKTSPPTWTFTGLDMSDAYFPRDAMALQENLTLHCLNILDPVPEEYQSRFDVVHLRLLIAGFCGKQQWQTAAEHVHQMLKPGGWIQWHESDFAGLTVLTVTPGANFEWTRWMVQKMVDECRKQGICMDVVPRLREIVQGAGFIECSEDTFSSDRVPETRMDGTAIEIGALASVLKFYVKAGVGVSWTLEEMEKIEEKGRGEVANSEGYIRWDMKIVTGRRPW